MSLEKDHLHIYRRLKGSKDIYVCDHPDCTHQRTKEYIVGKRATCPYCHEPYILDRRILRLAVPHCEECTKGTSKSVDSGKVDDIVSKVLGI